MMMKNDENDDNDEMMKNTHVKSSFVLEIFTFWSWFFGYVETRLDRKASIDKICDVTDCTTNNYNTHTTQYLKK